MSTQPQGRIPTWTPGDRFRKAREDAGFRTQGELADATGISRSTVSHLEVDKAPLKVIYLEAWARATGVSVDWIRYGDTTPPSPGRQTASGPETALDNLRAKKQRRTGGGPTNHRYPMAS